MRIGRSTCLSLLRPLIETKHASQPPRPIEPQVVLPGPEPKTKALYKSQLILIKQRLFPLGLKAVLLRGPPQMAYLHSLHCKCKPGPRPGGTHSSGTIQPRRPHGPTHWSAAPRSVPRRYPRREQDRPPGFATCPGPIDLLLRAVGHRGAGGAVEPYAHGLQDHAPACRCRSRRRSAGADPWTQVAGHDGEGDWSRLSPSAL